ncbi:hypothetical protein PTKIN_Ptkin09bG0133700 [Pterospermum kingtungense]
MRTCPQRAAVATEGSSEVRTTTVPGLSEVRPRGRPKKNKTVESSSSGNANVSTQSMRKTLNKGKEKVIEEGGKPVRTRKPTIKGYGLYTDMNTGQQTFYSGTKGIVIREGIQVNNKRKASNQSFRADVEV